MLFVHRLLKNSKLKKEIKTFSYVDIQFTVYTSNLYDRLLLIACYVFYDRRKLLLLANIKMHQFLHVNIFLLSNAHDILSQIFECSDRVK